MAKGFLKKVFSFGQTNNKDLPIKEDAAAPKPGQDTSSAVASDKANNTAIPITVSVDQQPALTPYQEYLARTGKTVQPSQPPQPDKDPVHPAKTEQPAPPIEKTEPASERVISEKPIVAEIAQPEISTPTTPVSTQVVPEGEISPISAAQPQLLNKNLKETQPEGKVADETAPEIPVTANKPKPLGSSKVKIGNLVEEIDNQEPQPVDISSSAQKRTWFERLKSGLSHSSRQLGDSIGGIFTKSKLNEDTLQDLEDVLIQADLGLETAMRITDTLSSTRYGKDISLDEVCTIMAQEIEKVLVPVAKPLELDLSHKPHVILVVGVNGTGKTTTIGKLAAKLTAGGLNVMLAAGDTFRAAAIEQLHIWGERTGATVISSKIGSDAASLAYDAYEKAKAEGSDVLIIDTAGRLQNKAELMEELAKIVRVLGKHDPDAPHTVLQTLDATTGQNALNQVEIFRNIAGVNGLVMTKLDGTARGGILVAIAAKHKLPVYFIGVGEGIDDLEPFSANEFADAIAGKHE